MGITRFDVQTAATQTRIADALERIAAALEVLADPPRRQPEGIRFVGL